MRNALQGRTGALVAGALITTGALAVYALTLCQSIPVGDSGELITAAATLGIPHPTGFPLYVLLGKLWVTALPLGSIALRMNLLSAFYGAAAVAGLYLLAYRLWRLSSVAFAVAGSFAFSLSFWSQATVARVYTLNALLLVVTWIVIELWRESGQRHHLAWAFAACGLSLANHTLGILSLVAVLLAIWSRRTYVAPMSLAVPATAALPGLALYAYVPLRSLTDPPLDWGNPESAANLIDYLTRAGHWSRAWVASPSDLVTVAGHVIATIPVELGLLGALGAFAGLVLLWRHGRFWLVTTTATVVANVALIAWHGSREDIFVWHRYLIPSFLAMSLPLGGTVAWLVRQLRRRSLRVMLVTALPVVSLIANWRANDRSRHSFAQDFAAGVLAALPSDATLVAQGDNVLFPLMVAMLAEGRRADVELVMRGIGDEPPLEINPSRDAVYFTHSRDLGSPHLRMDPHGLVFRVVPADSEPQQVPWEPVLDLADWVEADSQPPPSHDYLTRNLIGHYLVTWGLNLEAQQPQRAREIWTLAGRADYDNPNLHSNLGLLYQRNGWLEDALFELIAARALDPQLDDIDERITRLDHWVRARRQSPRVEAELRRVWARAAFRAGHLERAYEELSQVVLLLPFDARAHADLAALAVSLRRWDVARDAFRAAVEYDPTDEASKESLARMPETP